MFIKYWLGYFLGIPFQILGYFLLLLLLAVPAIIVTVIIKLFSPHKQWGGIFENVYTTIFVLYLLGIPLTAYYIWGLWNTVTALINGAWGEAFLFAFLLCPLVGFSFLVLIGLIMNYISPIYKRSV